MSENINFDYISEYIRALIPEGEPLLRQIEEQAHAQESYVPIAKPETAQLLGLLLRLKKPARVLEIGTGCAYSTIIIGRETAPECKITTVERYENVYERALSNLQRAGLSDKVKPLLGEAAEILPMLETPFDFIFLDAAKGQYINFLPELKRLLSPGGILLSDNVLYKGMTAENSLLERRKITIVKRLREYLEAISGDPELKTLTMPIGDGIALSLRKEEENA